MTKKETPEERKARLRKQLEKARAIKKANAEKAKAQKDAGVYVPPKPKRPRNLDRIVREIMNDDELVDIVVANQPEWWSKIPHKNVGYIMSTVMAVKAMGGDIKAAEWIRKTGFGDKVQLETDNGFFAKTDFTIQVVPSKTLEDGIDSHDVIEGEIRQIEE